MFGKAKETAGFPEEKDPERLLKLKECCDLLLAGGYFRARIPTLSPFDKVVGGLVWSLTASGVDVDVDIIFTENATIGQRIRLSDQLVKALVRMGSPHPLQSHQIQGLDYDHLFPVLQWLVRKVIEHRRLTGDLVRAQSLSHFSKSYALPSDADREQAARLVEGLHSAYARPQRKFRKKASSVFDSAAARTDATLLEYGERVQTLAQAALGEDEEKAERAAKMGGGARSALISQFESKNGGAQANAEKDAAAKAEAARREAARLEALRDQLDEAGTLARISGQNVGQLVGLQSAEIAKAAADYERMKAAEEEAAAAEGGALGKRGQEQAFQRQLEALKRKIAAAKEASEKKAAALAEAEAKAAEASARVAKEGKRIGRIESETQKLEAAESNSANREILSQLRSLVSLNESLRAQEAAFKEQCAAQRREYKAELARLDPSSGASAADDEESARMKAVEAMYAKELETLSKLRRVLARKNQEIAATRRRIDEVPTRAELLQYQHRFVELYELSSARHWETKRFFELYNSTHASHEFMQTEVKLLNSIIEAFPTAVVKGSPAARSEFLSKLESILDGVRQNREHVAAEIAAVQAEKEALNAKYMAAVDAQRRYVKLKKEFKEESIKNERLTEMMEEAEKQKGGAAAAAAEAGDAEQE